MKVIVPGHQYELDNLKDPGSQKLVFKNDGIEVPGLTHSGTYNQEVIRALIDRIQTLDRQVRWNGNDEIIYHLRSALVLHEARALIRKTEKGEINPESIEVDSDGHFKLYDK